MRCHTFTWKSKMYLRISHPNIDASSTEYHTALDIVNNYNIIVILTNCFNPCWQRMLQSSNDTVQNNKCFLCQKSYHQDCLTRPLMAFECILFWKIPRHLIDNTTMTTTVAALLAAICTALTRIEFANTAAAFSTDKFCLMTNNEVKGLCKVACRPGGQFPILGLETQANPPHGPIQDYKLPHMPKITWSWCTIS